MGRTYRVDISSNSEVKQNISRSIDILETIRKLYEKQYIEYLQNTWLAKLYKFIGLYTADEIREHALVNLTEPQLYYKHHDIKIGSKTCTTSMYMLDNRIDLLKDLLKSSKYVKSVDLSVFEYEDFHDAVNTQSETNLLCAVNKYDVDISEEVGCKDACIKKVAYRGPIYIINKLLGGNVYDSDFEELDYIISEGALILASRSSFTITRDAYNQFTSISKEQGEIYLNAAVQHLLENGYEFYAPYSEFISTIDGEAQEVALVKSSVLAEFKKGE